MGGSKISVNRLGGLIEPGSSITYGVVKPGKRVENGILFIRGGDVVDGKILEENLRTISPEISRQYSRTELKGGELLISLVGNPGQVALVPDYLAGANIARQVGLVRLNNSVVKRYVMYYLLSPAGKSALGAQSLGSVQTVINLRDLKNVKIPLPPLPEQRHIAHILGTLDDKIDLNRRMNATLEAIARAVFKSWFVDFDPVRAKASDRPSGLPAEIDALFPDSFEDSELGEIPKGWEVMRVGDVVEVVGGGTPSTKNSDYWEGGEFAFATPKDLSGLSAPILLSTEKKVTRAGLQRISSGLLPVGTMLMSSRAPVGYLAIAAKPVCINQGFIAMKCGNGLSNFFMLNWAQQNMYQIQAAASGTTFPEISKSNFRPMRVVIPDNRLLKAFDKVVVSIYSVIEANLKQSIALAHLRDSLLPDMLKGANPNNGEVSDVT